MLNSKKKNRFQFRNISYVFYTVPALIFYALFLAYPIISAFNYSFYKWDGVSIESTFVGLANYRYIFEDKVFLQTIKNTLVCVLVGPITQTFLALLLAVLISKVLKGKTLYRAVFYMPVILPLVAASIVWFSIYNPTFGMLNSFVRALGFQDFNQVWLGDPKTALLAVLVISIWRWTGFNIVIFMAGLQDISNEYYEAAQIDGANQWKCFWKITVPLLAPSIVINFALNLIGYLKLFDVIYVTTQGGPANSTEVLSTYIYKQAFQYNDVGMASAASVILFLLIAVFSGVYLFLISRKSD